MRRHRPSLWSNTFFSFAAPSAVGIAVIIMCCIIFSMLTFFVLKTMIFLPYFSIISLFCGGFSAGGVCGKFRRRRGLIDGIICGCILSGVVIAASAAVGGFPSIKKLLLLLAAGAVGGVMGVNSKRPKNLM